MYSGIDMFQCIHNYLLERVPSIGTWCGYIDTWVRWLLGEQVPVGQDIIYLVQKSSSMWKLQLMFVVEHFGADWYASRISSLQNVQGKCCGGELSRNYFCKLLWNLQLNIDTIPNFVRKPSVWTTSKNLTNESGTCAVSCRWNWLAILKTPYIP